MLDFYTLLGGLTLLVTLTVLVAAHEWGHYLFARMFGMEVEAFAIMLGGVRKTDLRERLDKPLVSGWVVFAVAAALLVGWDLIGRFGKQVSFDPVPFLLAVQVGAVLIVPLWIASRLTALYHTQFARTAKWFVIAWTGWFLAATIFGITKGLAVTGLVPLLAPVSIIALLFTYYIPVLGKGEEENYGKGQIKVGDEAVPVSFRPLASRTDKHGTEFALLLLPLGGFAKIKGMAPKEDGSEVNVPGGFFSKPPWQRLLVLFAGPLFSVIAGALLLTLLFTTDGISEPVKAPVLGKVTDDSAALRSGLRKGDLIVSLDGKPIKTFYAMRQYVSPRGGKPIIVEYRRNGSLHKVTVVPTLDSEPTPIVGEDGLATDEPKRRQGKMGAHQASLKKRVPFDEALVKGFTAPVLGAVDFFKRLAQPSQLKDDVGGIAAVAAMTDKAARSEEWLTESLALAAVLSISLGIFNLLPMYPLDGGQMVVAFAEMFRGGRRLSLRVQNAFSTLGIALIFMLVFFVLVNDTKKLSSGSKPENTVPAKTK